MAWIDVNIKLKSGSTTGMMNTGEVTIFNVPVKTKIKNGDTITVDDKSFDVTNVVNSRDEFLEVFVATNETPVETIEEPETEES